MKPGENEWAMALRPRTILGLKGESGSRRDSRRAEQPGLAVNGLKAACQISKFGWPRQGIRTMISLGLRQRQSVAFIFQLFIFIVVFDSKLSPSRNGRHALGGAEEGGRVVSRFVILIGWTGEERRHTKEARAVLESAMSPFGRGAKLRVCQGRSWFFDRSEEN